MDRPGVRQVPEGSGEQGKWRKLVAKSSVVPQRPLRLRDWWWWWWWWHMTINIKSSLIAKKVKSSEDTVETDIFWLYEPLQWPWPWSQQTNFLHDTPTHVNTPPYHVWLQKVDWFRSYHPDKHLSIFQTYAVTLTLSTAVQLFTGRTNFWWCPIWPSLVANGSKV